MRFTVSGGDSFGVAIDQTEVQMAKAHGAAMREGTLLLKTDMRELMRDVGLGNRLAGTWQGRTYPQARESLEPATYVWSKAPKIILAFSQDTVITPRGEREVIAIGGRKMLAIPYNKALMKKGGRVMTVAQVEAKWGQHLIILRGRRPGVFLGYVNVIKARSVRRPGLRRATARRLAQGRQARLVRMFTFVDLVRLKKRFDLQRQADLASARVPGLIDKAYSELR